MKLDNDNLIKKWEALRLEAYLPTPEDRWTIGWGHTKGVHKGMTITRAEAEQFFDNDVKWAEDAVNKHVTVGLTQHQFDALVSLTFNIGATAFKKSTCLKRLNAGDYEGAAEALTWWNKQNGKTLRGLVRRRAEEKEYFLSSDVAVTEQEESLTPTGGDEPKPLWASREVIAGSGAVLSGGGAFVAGLVPSAQVVLVAALSVALLAFGAYVIYNRVKARKKGER